MAGPLEGRELNCHVPWIWWIGFVVPPLGFAFFAVATFSIAWSCFAINGGGGYGVSSAEIEELRRSARQLLFLGAFHTAAALYFGYSVVTTVLAVRRTSITVESRGMTVTDRRGRKTEIPWHEIEEMRVTTGGMRRKWANVQIVGGGKRVNVHAWVQDREMLLDEVVARADLEKGPHNWYRTLYLRKQPWDEESESPHN